MLRQHSLKHSLKHFLKHSPQVQVEQIDATGAGDAFFGGLVAGENMQ